MRPRSSWSIRTRLTAWYVLVLTGILTGYVVAVFVFQYALLQRQMYHDEVQDVETVEGLLFFDGQGRLQLQQSYFSHPQSHLLVDRLMEVRDLSGAALYRSPTLNGQVLGGASRAGEGDASFDERTVKLADGSRVFLISHRHPVDGRQLLIRLAYSLSPLSSRMLQFLALLLIAMPIALIVAAFAGYGIAKRAFMPLDAMAARAEQITASNLHDRLIVDNQQDELGHMARVFNHLLGRLEQAFSQLQRFTADAAHELRTPLASLRATGELAIESKPEQAGYRDAISSMLEETVRLSQTIDGLLILSRTEAQPTGDAQTRFLLSDVIHEILSLLEVVIEERRLTVVEHVEGPPQQAILADRSLVRLALLNVLHNATKFSPPGSALDITYSHIPFNSQTAQRVCIQDAGPGIVPGEHERLFERFFTSRSPETAPNSGSGLGLSIAKLTIERCGGQIHFDPSSSTGARCCIDLPIA